jgi:hypothetical protein
MTFGSTGDFAIEACVEPDLAPPNAVWGRMQVWCRHIPLGKIERRYCHLGPAYHGFCDLVRGLSEAWDESLATLDDRAAFNFLDGLLYGYCEGVEIEDGRSLRQIRADAARYGKFDFLTNWGEPFDGYKAFLMCPPQGDVRVLCREIPSLRADVSKSAVLSAAGSFVTWYEEQEQRLRG